MLSTIISIVLKAVIAIIAVLITGYVIPCLKDKRIYDSVVIMVQAAEQIIKESGKGVEKYALVEEWIIEKFHLSPEDAKSLIESAVYEMNLMKDL